ncbi:hypothetical protein BJX70DRAFT_92157 [Aspergillus crustosus]
MVVSVTFAMLFAGLANHWQCAVHSVFASSLCRETAFGCTLCCLFDTSRYGGPRYDRSAQPITGHRLGLQVPRADFKSSETAHKTYMRSATQFIALYSHYTLRADVPRYSIARSVAWMPC